MTSQKTCPKCKGRKIIVGNCECNPEWRASDGDDHYDDCQCEPDIDCPQCQGTGVVE